MKPPETRSEYEERLNRLSADAAYWKDRCEDLRETVADLRGQIAVYKRILVKREQLPHRIRQEIRERA